MTSKREPMSLTFAGEGEVLIHADGGVRTFTLPVSFIEKSAYDNLLQSLIDAKKQRDIFNVERDEARDERDRLKLELERAMLPSSSLAKDE